jgi:predicted nucleotidyltransferase
MAGGPKGTMPPMPALPALITDHLAEVRALCEKYRVKRLTLFGSAVKGTFDPEKSDLDFVVEFEWDPDPLERGRRWTGLWEDLKDLFDHRIDLIVASTLKNPYVVRTIEDSHVDLYAA